MCLTYSSAELTLRKRGLGKCDLTLGGELDSTGYWKSWWRVVVSQRAT